MEPPSIPPSNVERMDTTSVVQRTPKKQRTEGPLVTPISTVRATTNPTIVPVNTNATQSPAAMPTFFVLHSMIEKTLGDMSPFFIEKSISGLVGTVKKISKMRSGDLLVETPNSTIARNLMRVTAFGEIPISVTPHRSLNSSRGVVISRDLIQVSEQELKEGLEAQGVIEVKRIMLRRDGTQVPSRVLILTFSNPKLPESVKVGYLHCTVRPYVPNPLRCFLCQRYGHSRNTCRGSPICARCATSDHDFEACQLDPVCANCQGSHPAYSRTCPIWQKERAVQQYRVDNNVSYPEARRAVMPTNDRPSYSSVVKVQMASSVTQTEVTIPPSQNLTFTKPKPIASTSHSTCSHTPPKSSQLSNVTNPPAPQRASYEAHMRRTPAQQPPIFSVVQKAVQQSPKPVPAVKPAMSPAGKPVQGATACGSTPRRQSSGSTQTNISDSISESNAFSVLSTASGSGAIDRDMGIDEGMEVDGRGNSPRKKNTKPKRERERILPPP